LMPGMAGMLIGFVEHSQAHRRKGLGQLLRNGFLHTRHRGLTEVMNAFTLFLLYFNPLHCVNQRPWRHACLIESVKLARRAEFSA
jgi:hypothetical protein